MTDNVQSAQAADDRVPTLHDALKYVSEKAECAANYLKHDQLFPEEKTILDCYIPNNRASELSIRDALRVYTLLQKVAIKRMH